MKADKTKERLHITDIKVALANLEQSVFSKAESDEQKAGLLALKIACNVFEGLSKGPLPIDYSHPRVKECSLHVAAAMDLVRYARAINDKTKLKPLKNTSRSLVRADSVSRRHTLISNQNRALFKTG